MRCRDLENVYYKLHGFVLGYLLPIKCVLNFIDLPPSCTAMHPFFPRKFLQSDTSASNLVQDHISGKIVRGKSPFPWRIRTKDLLTEVQVTVLWSFIISMDFCGLSFLLELFLRLRVEYNRTTKALAGSALVPGGRLYSFCTIFHNKMVKWIILSSI